MFTPEQRSHLRAELLERAAADARITGAAITGSAAADREDRWSDIDLAFGVASAETLPDVVNDWTACMYGTHDAVHHLDVRAGAWLYRVFLLPTTLQVDLAFVPADEFRALAPTFRLISGTARDARAFPPPSAPDIIGYGWLYALHARSCIARNKFWQAEYMISALRGNALALACIRHGLPTVHGRGMDSLPADVTRPFEEAIPRELNATGLSRAFRAALDGLLREIRLVDVALGSRLHHPLISMKESAP